MTLLQFADEVIQKHRHPNQINLLSELKRTFTPPRTPGLQYPRPKTPPTPELPAHLPDSIVNPILARRFPEAQISQYDHERRLKGGPSRVVGSAAQAGSSKAHQQAAMHFSEGSKAGDQVLNEDSRTGPSVSRRQPARHTRSQSTENTMNLAAPAHTATGLDDGHRWENTARSSENTASCSASSMHGCHTQRMQSYTSDAATDTHATAQEDVRAPSKPLVSPGLATEDTTAEADWVDDNLQTSIAVQWGLLDTANEGDTLGHRLVAEYQVGPCMAPSTMAAVGFTPQLHGPAAYMV